MAASILAPFKPTRQPFAEGPRGVFTLSWAQQPIGGLTVRPLGPNGTVDAQHERICVVRCEAKNREFQFHSRKARNNGRWVLEAKAWVFPEINAQKVADLVDQVSGYLLSQGVVAPTSQACSPIGVEASEASSGTPIEESNERMNAALLARSLLAPWTFESRAVSAVFYPVHPFFNGPAVRLSFPLATYAAPWFSYDQIGMSKIIEHHISGSIWDADSKAWVVPGRSIRLARKLLAAVLRYPRWLREKGRRLRAELPSFDFVPPPSFSRECGDIFLDDPAQRVFWVGCLFDRSQGLQSLSFYLMMLAARLFDGSRPPSPNDAGDSLPWLWSDQERPSPPAPPTLSSAFLAASGAPASLDSGTARFALAPIPDWNRKAILAGIRFIQILAKHIEFGAEGLRVRANHSKSTPNGVPILQGAAPTPGELFFSQGRFWLVASVADAKSKHQRCWAVSKEFANAWLYPGPRQWVKSEEISAMSDSDVFLWLVQTMRSDRSVGCAAIRQAHARFETLTGDSLSMSMVRFEQASLRQEIDDANNAARVADHAFDDSGGTEAPRRSRRL